MNRLRVHYNGWGEHWPLGTLAEFQGGTYFEYSSEALTAGIEFSPMHWPLKRGAHRAPRDPFNGLPGLIADSLPDGWGMLLMDRAFRKTGREPSTLSPLDRLAFIGNRGMGALTFEPDTGEPLTAHDVSLLNLAKQVERVMRGASAAVLRELLYLGGSPQGARPKALVNFNPKTGHLSAGGDTPIGSKPWLVKFPATGEHAEAAAVEEWYARLARACGIDMPPSRYFKLDRNHAAFGVQRFDRMQGKQGSERALLHTLAGAMHADFRLPSLDAMDFLRFTHLMTHSMHEVRRAFERCAFNLLFHNRDDHAKNFSYRLGHDRRWALSPAYDLTFSTGMRGHHQMAYAGEALEPGWEHLLKVAKAGGLTPAVVRATVDTQRTVAARAARYVKELPIRKATLRIMGEHMARNSARLATS